MVDAKGALDIFGRAYDHPAGTSGADLYGDLRPFQTEPHLTLISGKDFFGIQSSNLDYLQGPKQDLRNNPSFPSGHTTYGYAESLILALLVPQRYLEMLTRAAEYSNNRIILGAHYAMDVLGGRTLATYDIAHLLANKAEYVGAKRGKVVIDNYQEALASARADMTAALEKGCGNTLGFAHVRTTVVLPIRQRTRLFMKPLKPTDCRWYTSRTLGALRTFGASHLKPVISSRRRFPTSHWRRPMTSSQNRRPRRRLS